jgi:isopentenyl-diphosphate Delta-isomerase
MRIPIVNEQDEIIGYKERSEIKKEDIYRVSALWITDENGKVLLAKRALTKAHSPGKWGPAVAGTLEEGDTYEGNIIKEAGEELGLRNIKPIFLHKRRRAGENNFFAAWYALKLSSTHQFALQEEEVTEVRWWNIEELAAEIKMHPERFTGGAPKWLEEVSRQP